jgi:Ca2+:H+ antiporter
MTARQRESSAESMDTAQAAPGPQSSSFASILREEWFLGVSIATCLVFLLFRNAIAQGATVPWLMAIELIWLFAVVLGSALSVVRHAEHLAAVVGEPYGTLILTLSVCAIEALSISAVMLHGANNPTLARDTLFAVVMIILNGMVGLSLLFGGWRHKEQYYNLQGANTYLGVIIPLTVLSLILPGFTSKTAGPTLPPVLAFILVLISVGLYCAFLAVQTGRHRSYFVSKQDEEEASAKPHQLAAGHEAWLLHAVLLGCYMIPVVYLAEQLAVPIDYLIETLAAPTAIGGVIIAVLTATPEALGATRAAFANQMQRSVNIFLGSVLSTIGLTIPIMLIVGYFARRDIILGLEHTDFVMLLLTLAICAVTFASGRTNILQGVVHLVLFMAYILLIFAGQG